MTKKEFTGNKKAPMKSLLAKPEKRFVDFLTPRFPRFLETYHLTLMTIPWSAGVIIFGYLAGTFSHLWLHLSSFMLFLQWFTDAFDGAIGRYRDTGLLKWGFYMDHFLDFVFMSAVFIGWTFLFEGTNNLLMWFLVPAIGCLMVNSFLAFGATGEFKITYLRTGPTELRLAFIIINTIIAFAGTELISVALPYIFALFWLGVVLVVYRTQKHIWKLDMQHKANNAKESA
ncbi:hypothetical protein STSP2_01671 [Anaerohalosphaera lusitana]|uniref:CDP-alcohol phosphatidyltransferase n=1 Tax=Anaerohalosphaera lusitana TaxID=1936003 RepID=A0A1U9NLZ5_9BACT|nr:CDP-alcohol phosphatidyltransferase family protein [Anaerohalosphaera lusitana]AQT68506.1 hypothetical protein STSP2_01671 [Anaerohalosphaera lusitana]